MPERWTPDSWRKKPILQVPDYPTGRRSQRGATARDLPAAGFCGRGAQPQEALGRVAVGKAFLLQGGDCAESFRRALHANNIRDFFRVILQMAVVLTYAAASPVVKVGRIAGQFAKPRSSPTEKRDGEELPSYRGDIINGIEFTAEARLPDPRRQIEAYRQSAATLNLLRAFAHGGYANLANVHQWMLGFVKDSPAVAPLRGARRPHLRGARLHAGLRARSREPSRAARDRFLYQPRGAAARLRAGDDARGFDAPATGTHLRPHAVDRRPHPPARPCPCRVLPRHQEPDRPEMRSVAASSTSCCG